jgi:hypothetical protein
MSEGFHVHGPHDHEVEHQAQHGDSFASRIAVMTAILATVGALFSYEGGHHQNEALLYKNEATIKKTEASDQWNYYQAKSNKQNLSELAAAIAPVSKQEFYKNEIERYKKEKADIKAGAEKLEELGREADKKSGEAMYVHERWAQAMTLEQIAISLAAITLLTRRRWLQATAYTAAGIGVAIGILALMHI